MVGVLALSFACSLAAREVVNFNADWRFLKADPASAESTTFADAAWESVSLPHTFNDTDTFDNWSLPGHRGEQEQWSGRTWYRKIINVPAAWSGQKVFVEFEAVRQIAEVYLNGVKLGTAKGGFTPFGFDLTPHLQPGAVNVLAVMVDNRFSKDPLDASSNVKGKPSRDVDLHAVARKLDEQMPGTIDELRADQIPWNNPHWHPGHGGIYRNVRLIVTDPLHVTLPLYSFLETEGPYVYATEVTADSAAVGLEIPLRNDRAEAVNADVRAEIIDADGRSVATTQLSASLAAGASTKLTAKPIKLTKPRLWEPGYPHLYRVLISIGVAGKTVDQVEIPLGVRAIRWSKDTGLWINEAHYKLHGWGQKPTNEWPGLGAALPDWLHAYTLKLMRDAGGNFVRWGHVPAGQAQIRAADSLGIVTLQPGGDGEGDTVGGAWALRVANFRDVLIYFRNHPSIFIWEGGNQRVSREHAAELRALMDKFDPHGQRAYTHRRADKITAQFMDVAIGTEGDREFPDLPVVEGEYNREESPRRVWDDASPPNFGYPEAKGQTYQLTSEQFGVQQVAHYVRKLGAPSHAGGANWLFTDSTSGGRVAVEVARTSGEMDGVRLPKEAYFVTQAMWSDAPRVQLIGHWTYPAGTKKTIYAVANTGGEVELRLNGKPLGRAQPVNRYLYTFPDVTFADGKLEAVAYDKAGLPAASHKLETTGPAVALRLTSMVSPDGWIADGADIVLFDVEAVDAQGRRTPTFQQRVDFELSGPGVWRGGYNSGKIYSINQIYLDLEAGINRVAVRATREPGEIQLRVRTQGLTSTSATVSSTGFVGRAPALLAVTLPAAPIRQAQDAEPSVPSPGEPTKAPGRLISTLTYTGPRVEVVRIVEQVADGMDAYADVPSPLRDLPPRLSGADLVRAPNADALYSAEDFIDFSVSAPVVVTIAHDDRLPVPAWLLRNFNATKDKLTVLGQAMTLYTRRVTRGSSLTLGSNTEDSSVKIGLMYIVFVKSSEE